MASDKIVSNDADDGTGRANILLSTSVDHAEFTPVDRLGEEVARHVADEVLTLRHAVEGEVVAKLEALDSLIVAIVEELRVGINRPLGGVSHGRVSSARIVRTLVRIAVLARLFDGTLRPGARGDVIGRLALAIFQKVVADRGELQMCAALEHEDSEVVRNVEEGANVGASLFCDRCEGFATMAHLHDTNA